MINDCPRLHPPFWRRDAYALNHLARAVAAVTQAWTRDWQCRTGRCTVVDLGAGDAPYRPLFASNLIDYVCCDLNPKAQVVIEPGKPSPLSDGVAQAVVSFQVLEHVWDLDWYLGEARRLMAEDGTLLLTTHGTWLYHPHPTDYRRWTRDGLVAELTTRGFEVTRVQGLVGPLAWTTQFRALGFHHLLSSIPLVGNGLAAVVSTVFHLRMTLEDWLTPVSWIESNAAIYLVVARKARPAVMA